MSKTNKKSSKLWWLTPLILYLFISTILTLVLCFIFNIRYKSVDENVEKWNILLADSKISTQVISGEVKSKSKYEGELDKNYTLIVTDDECAVTATADEYESVNVGDTITYYLSSGVYPREIVTDEKGRCTGEETVTAGATSAIVAEQEVSSAVNAASKDCPAEWVFCSKHRVAIYIVLFCISMLVSWGLLVAFWYGVGTGSNVFSKKYWVSPDQL